MTEVNTVELFLYIPDFMASLLFLLLLFVMTEDPSIDFCTEK